MSETVLSTTEIMHGALVGIRRKVRSLGWASTNYIGDSLDPWGRDIESACAELAAAKVLGVFFDFSEGRFCGQGDDIRGWQVRWTQRLNGHLVLRPRDPDEDRYLLVTGQVPTFQIRGWILGAEGKSDLYRSDPGERGIPCWLIPQDALHDVRQGALL